MDFGLLTPERLFLRHVRPEGHARIFDTYYDKATLRQEPMKE